MHSDAYRTLRDLFIVWFELNVRFCVLFTVELTKSFACVNARFHSKGACVIRL